MNKPVGIGIVGCGGVSSQYLSHFSRFPVLKAVACADIVPSAAEEIGRKFGVPRVCSVPELLDDPEVELVLNLTIPKAHAPVALAAIKAGKHVYQEKPLGVTRAEGAAILHAAARKKLKVGCAPDTFMGSGLQTARKAIDDGRIGKPVGFTAFMMCPGHEAWHPNPEFHYQPGGGPMFDMGPYYLTALLNLLGPVRRLCGIGAIEIPRRTIGSGAKAGKKIKVTTPDLVAGVMEFKNGAVGTIIQSFATHHAPNGTITIFGTEGTLQVPDPNRFGGPVKLRLKNEADWTELPQVFAHEYGRSVGLADMAQSIRDQRPFRASGEQAMAVLDLMQGFLDSSVKGVFYQPRVAYKRPRPMPLNNDFAELH